MSPVRMIRLLPVLLALCLAQIGCAFMLPVNAVDSNTAQGLLNTLFLSTNDDGPPTYSVGGSAANLAGSGLTLQDSVSGRSTAVAGGSTSFALGGFGNGERYSLALGSQPSGPNQLCTLTGSAGTIAGASVSDHSISCVTNQYTVGGTVTGLLGGGMILQNNGADDQGIAADGAFTFATAIDDASSYSVTVSNQPSTPNQICSVSNGSGSLGGANVTNVNVTCSTSAYTIGGTISGLAGSGLVLQNNAGDDLAVSANGAFTFATPVADLAGYNVTVLTQPSGPPQTCTVTGGSGSVSGGNVTSVSITCATLYSIGGTVSGLAGTGMVLRNNGGDDLAISANGAFTFSTSQFNATGYNVTVSTSPSGPSQTCNVTSGSGTVSGANVTNVTISCATDSFTVGGTVSGLAGAGLVLRNNGGDDLNVSASGGFTFSTALTDLSAYSVTVATQPSTPNQVCTVSSGSGSLAGANVTSVSINCATTTYTVAGTVSGLTGTGLVLQNNGGDNLNIAGNGGFTFATALADLSAYNVTVSTQPSGPAQTCSVSGGSGTLAGGNYSGVSIACVPVYSIGGTVSGLAGTGLVLRNNGGDDLNVSSNGAFTFATTQLNGTGYNVTVHTQPTGPNQTCSVSSGSGTVSGADVTSVSINCVTTKYTIGGSLSLLDGTGLVLRNNGGDDLALSGNGGFTFATAIDDGSAYSVTVSTSPSSPYEYCVVTNASGTLSGANVTNVAVKCFDPDDFGPTMWLTVDSISQGNGTAVSSWTDSVGGYGFSQGSVSNQPFYYTSGGPSGGPMLRFDGSNDRMSNSSPFSFSNLSIFLVSRMNQTGSNRGLFVFRPSSGNDFVNGLVLQTNSTNSLAVERQANGFGPISTSFSQGNWNLASAVYGSTSGGLYVNGGSAVTDTYTNAGVISPIEMLIGARHTGGYIFYGQNDYTDILAFSSALSDENRRGIECYFKGLYGLSISNTSCP